VTNSPNAIINWQGFSIGTGEITRFQQQSAASAVLNRVVGQDPSAILGTLWSNGKVYLVNPNGILFGQGSRVDVAGLVATTLNLSNNDFLAGRLNFESGAVANSILNQGEIVSGSGGRILLIAPEVQNHGLISSPQGEVVLAAGKSVQLVEADLPMLKVEVQAGGEALNVGQILAEGGKIGVYAGLINQRGVVRADSASVDATGKIVFRSSDTTILDAGSVTSAAGAKGGEVQVLGDKVGLLGDAKVDASGEAGGGTVLIGGDFQGKNPEVQNAYRTYFGPEATIKADALTSGDGGKVIVWSDDATRAYGTISARGGALSGNGGFVEVSGKRWLDFGASVNTLAPNGTGGTLLLDPMNVIIDDGISTYPAGGGSTSFDQGATDNVFTSSAGDDTAALTWGTIDAALAASSNVWITTSSSGTTNPGNIAIVNTSLHTYTSSSNLNLVAHNDITVDGAFANTGSGGITLRAGWNGSIALPGEVSGTGTLNINQSISGGQFVNLRAGKDIAIGDANAVTIQAIAGAPGLTTVSLVAVGGSITKATGVNTTTITAQPLPNAGGGQAQITISANSGITLNKTNVNAFGAGSASSAAGGPAQVDMHAFNGNLLLNQTTITATGGAASLLPGGAATVQVTADNGSIAINSSPISATGGDGPAGGAASVTLNGKSGITVDTSSLGAQGGLTSSGAFSPDATVTLMSTSGAIVVQSTSAIDATGGDTVTSSGAGKGTVTLDAATDLTITDSTVSAQGGNAVGTPPSSNALGADALISLTSGGVLTITGSTTSITAAGGNGGGGAALFAPEAGGAGGAASVSLDGVLGTTITDASLTATGGAGGAGGASGINSVTGANGGAGGGATISIDAGAASQAMLTSTMLTATGGNGGAGGNNTDTVPGGVGGDGGAGGVGSITVTSDSHATLSAASLSATSGNGGAEGIGFSGFGTAGVAGVGSVSVASTGGNVTVDSGSTLISSSTDDATTTLDAGATLTVQGASAVTADASGGVFGTVTLNGVTEVKVLSSSLIEAKGGTQGTVEINPFAGGADVTITDSTLSTIGSSGGGNGGAAKVTIKGTGTIAVTNSTVSAQGGSGDADGGNATIDVSAGTGVSLGGGSFAATVGNGGSASAIVYVNASAGNIVSSADVTADGPTATILTGEGTFTGSIVLRATSGFIHDGTAGAAGGVLEVLNASPGTISMTASDGVGEIGNAIRIFDNTPDTFVSNSTTGDIALAFANGNVAIDGTAGVLNSNAGGTYAITAESGNLDLNVPFLPSGSALAAGQNVFLTASGSLNLNSTGSIAAAANGGLGGEVRLVSGTGVSQNFANAPVTAAKLLADGGTGPVLMNTATNMVGMLAGQAGGDFRFRNGQALQFDSVGGVDGVSATNSGSGLTVDVHVTSGDLSIAKPVTASGGSSDTGLNVNLTAAAGAISATAAISATGGVESFSGVPANITLTASGGIAVNGTSVTATGGDGAGSGSGGAANVRLFAGGTIDLTGSTVTSTGGLGAGAAPNGTGGVLAEVSTFSGNIAASGNIVVGNIQADNVELQQNSVSSVTGNSIQRASAASLIQASQLLMEVDHQGLTSGGAIGTATEPMRIQANVLEAHTHDASAGIFIDSPNAGDLQIGGVSFFGGVVKGVQNVSSGEISISVNGGLSTLAGTATPVCGGGSGGPICTTSGNVFLTADTMNIQNSVNAGVGTGTVVLAPFTAARDINIESSPTGGLSLSPSALQNVTANLLEIGRAVDEGGTPLTGTLTVASALDLGTLSISSLRLAHENVTFAANVSKTAGADATLDVRAANDVLVNSGVAISSASGALTVILNSDRDGLAGGRIAMASGSSILSNGGDVTLGGGADPLANPAVGGTGPNGVRLDGTSIDAGVGNISIRGEGQAGVDNGNGVALVSGAVVQTTSGGIDVVGVGGGGGTTNNGTGIILEGVGTKISSASGAIALTGFGASGAGADAVGITLQSEAIVESTLTATISMAGTGGAGLGGNNEGIRITGLGTAVRSVDGAITLTGTGGGGPSDAVGSNQGITIFSGAVVESTG
ncbi:MAG: hypothetical protein A3I63_04645, partial [Betaproteobacteria bacterium RIFCSPLOWO2_02_FULL_66_14]